MHVATITLAMIAMTVIASAETFDDRWKGIFGAREANNSASYIETEKPPPPMQKTKMRVTRVANLRHRHHRKIREIRSRRTLGRTVSSAPSLKSLLWPF
jgi:hypothetical protein